MRMYALGKLSSTSPVTVQLLFEETAQSEDEQDLHGGS